MKIAFKTVVLIITCHFVGLGSLGAEQTAYKFTSIADTNGQFSGFEDSSFTVNSSGTVAFSAALKAGGRGIFKSADGKSYTKIIQIGDQLEFNSPSDKRAVTDIGRTAFINFVGQVAFNAVFGQFAEGIYIGNGGVPTRAATNYYYDLRSPSINSEGKAAWTGFFGFESTGFNSSRRYVLRAPTAGESGSQGTAGAILAHTGGQDNITGFFSDLGNASINDGGTVAFRASIRSGGEGIYVGKEALPDRFGPGDAKTTLVANNVAAGSPFSNFGSFELRPEINNLNLVVFGANLKTGGHGIFKGFVGGTAPQVVADNSGAYSKVFLNPAINSSGQVIFVAQRINGRLGIYKGANPETDLVVESGASLFGSTLAGVAIGPRTLTDEGKVAFLYQLTDGRRGLAVATPDGEKKPTGDLVIKESGEPASAFRTYGLYSAFLTGEQLRKVTLEQKIGVEQLFDVELTCNATKEETYILSGTETGDPGWKVEALAGTFDNWPAIKSGGASVKMQPGSKLSLKMRVSATDGSTPLPRGSKRNFTLSVKAATDISFTHDSVGADVKVDVPIVVNMTGDEPDADSSDGLPDIDLDKDGLQTTLRCALEYTNGRSGGDVIKFKIPAEDPGIANGVAIIKPKNPLPKVTKTVTIDGSTQDPASATPPVQLDGADLPRPANTGGPEEGSLEAQYDFMLNWPGAASGLVLEASGCKIYGLALVRFPLCGVEIKGPNNSIQGCHIGIDAKGIVGSANGDGDVMRGSDTRGSALHGAGIIVRSSSNQIGGGLTSRDRNLISGTSGASHATDPSIGINVTPPGIIITGPEASANTVAGNYFGLNSSGGIPQLGAGSLVGCHSIADIVIYNASGNVIGGTTASRGNSFAYHGTGVLLLGKNATLNLLFGNQFGVNELLKSEPVWIENARSNNIGGTEAGARNRMVGSLRGVFFAGAAQGNLCVGNEITTQYGVWFERSNYSPGAAPSDNIVATNNISSSLRGVEILAASNIKIRGNAIHGNLREGVEVKEGTQIRITENLIYDNGGLGISLGDPEKPTLNDFGDHDGGPNGRQNFPVIGKAIVSPGGITASGSLSTTSGRRFYHLEFFASQKTKDGYGEGQRFLGSLDTTTSFSGEATFSFSSNVGVKPGEFITATATDPDGNTSEFSKAIPGGTGVDGDRDGVDDGIENRVPSRGGASAPSSSRATPGAGENPNATALSGASLTAALGDGNGDGILDSQQGNVASFLSVAGSWITLVSPSGTKLESILPGGPPEFDHRPAGIVFPVGFMSFKVTGVTPGGAVAIRCIFHAPAKYSTAFGYGLLKGATQASWYQFGYNGATGAALGNAELTLHFVDGARGDHDLQANGQITTLLAPADAAGNLLNISTRLQVRSGESVLIGGFIITGNEPKKVIIRAIGPSLAAVGLSGALANPFLELHDGTGAEIASNDDWKQTQKAEIVATSIAPSHDLESAIVRTLAPGSYTAVVRGQFGSTGIGVVEAYDLGQSANAKLANIATRGFVDTGDNVMIGGFIIGNNDGTNSRVVVRALGPTLTAFGIAGALADPTLELKNANGVTLASNDNWGSAQAQIAPTGLAPKDAREAALVASIPNGNYTAIVRGKNGATGVAVVEVYNVF